MNPLNLLLPKSCVFCGARSVTELCENCRLNLPWLGEVETLNSGITITAPLKYEGSARAALLRFKFNGRTQYAGAFTKLMAVCARNLLPEFDVIAFIPLSLTRRLKRGYNQTKLLANALAREFNGVKVIAPLRKSSRAANSTLNREERIANVKGAFSLKRGVNIKDKRILLTDDVLTTGSTLSECASVLLRGGAASVVCVTVCRA